MLARAFTAIGARDDAVTVFAKGVADSRTTSISEFDRESRDLERAIGGCLAERRTLVYLSGAGAIYGRRASLRHEDDVLLPETPYGRHQVACEQAIASSGVGYLIARIPNAVGHPQRAAQLVPALVQQVQAGRVAVSPGASRDLIDAADVAALVSALLGAGARNVTVNVASGHQHRGRRPRRVHRATPRHDRRTGRARRTTRSPAVLDRPPAVLRAGLATGARVPVRGPGAVRPHDRPVTTADTPR